MPTFVEIYKAQARRESALHNGGFHIEKISISDGADYMASADRGEINYYTAEDGTERFVEASGSETVIYFGKGTFLRVTHPNAKH